TGAPLATRARALANGGPADDGQETRAALSVGTSVARRPGSTRLMTPAAAASSARVTGFQSRTAVRRMGSALRSRELPTIPDYDVQRRVGQGRMSTAWLARDLRRGGDVVLKVLNAGHA